MLTKLGDINDIAVLSAIEKLPDVLPWTKFGTGTVGTELSTVFSAGVAPGLYQYFDEPTLIAIASTDPDDTLGGAGANQIIVSGLRWNSETGKSYLDSELLQLNGQTPVSSTKDFYRIFYIRNRSLVGHDLQGQLYLGDPADTWIGGEPSIIRGHVNDGFNRTQMVVYTVPSGYKLFVKSIVMTAGSGKEADFYAFGRDSVVPTLSENYVFEVIANWLTLESPIVVDLSKNPFVLPENYEFDFRAKTDVGTLNVAVNSTGLLVPEKYFGEAWD